jgi:hypothetical protein
MTRFYSEEEYDLYDNNAVSVINEIDEDGSPNEDAYYMAVDDKNKILLRDLEDMLWYKNYQRYHLVGILEIHIMELRKIF